MFQSVELLKPLRKHYEELFNEFRAYKGKIPVCGCVLLDATLTKVVLVQNWAKTSWGLPKGKLNQNEKKAECAIREVGEETGYDVLLSFTQEEALEVVNQDQHAAMFVVPDVDVNFVFEPRVRKEISNIKFFPLDALPSKQWGVDTYVPKIKRWVKRYKLKHKHSAKAVPVEEDEVSPPASPRVVPLSPSSITRGSPRRQVPLVFDFGRAKILAAFDEKFDPCLARARRELEDALVEADQRSASRSPETELEPSPLPRPRRAAVTRASAVAAASKDGGWGAAAAAPPKRKKTKKKKGKTPPPPAAATMNDDEEGYA
jgi:mRNA-decapping enzyme subunit 2